MVQSYLEKNLEQIAKYDKELANKIRNHSNIQGDFEFSQTKCGDANLLLNGEPLHDEIDALDEANKLWNQTSNKNEDVTYFLFGLGLGYTLFKFAKEAKGKIILYEPNIDILRITLEVVDLSEILAKENVRIFQNLLQIKLTTEKLYKKDDNITMSFLNSYKKLYPKELIEFKEELEVIMSLFATGYKEMARQSLRWSLNSVTNISKVLQNEEIEALKGKFKDKPALIVSAGPSLNKSIEYIKKHRENIVVFCVNVALKTLLKNDIQPDFVCVVEANGCTPSIEGVDTSKLNFIMPPEVNPRMYDKKFKRAFNYYTENILTSDWIADFTQINCEEYKNRGTVSILSLWSAYMMGCNPIILTGQDLAYASGECYAKDSTYDLICELNEETKKYEIKPKDMEKYIAQTMDAHNNLYDRDVIIETIKKELKRRSEQVITVKGQNNDLLPTSSGYSLFIKHFEELTPLMRNVKLFNTSEGGALIRGYENQNLDELCQKVATKNVNTENTIEESLKHYTKPASKESIIKKYEKNIEEVQKCIKTSKSSQEILKKLNNQYKRTKRLSEDLKILLQKVHNNYSQIIQENFKTNRLIAGLLYKNFMEVEERLNEFETDKNTLNKLLDSYKDFFFVGNKHGEDALTELKKQKEATL